MRVTYLLLLVPTMVAGGMVPDLEDSIRSVNPKICKKKACELKYAIVSAANKTGLDAALIAAVIAVESKFDEGAIGPKGELGLMQLRPEMHLTNMRYSKRMLTMFSVIEGTLHGARYLAHIRDLRAKSYRNFSYLELYNRGINSHPRTFKYTKRVLSYYKAFGGVVE